MRQFAERRRITYPLLSDPGSNVIRQFGILNTNIPEDQPFFGVPFPGYYLIDEKGVVRAKYFEDDYRQRFTSGFILQEQFGVAKGSRGQIETRHLLVCYHTSDPEVWAGSHLALLVQLELKEGMHVYAPGVTGGYRPLRLELAAGPFTALPLKWPKSEMLYLKAIDEKVPVYRGAIKLRQQLVMAQQRELEKHLTEDRKIVIRGVLHYQACDEKKCYLPEKVPLIWVFDFRPLDRQRIRETQ